MKIGKAVTIIVKFYAVVDDKTDASEATGYVLDSGQLQDAIIEYAADHGCKVQIARTWHDVEPNWPSDVDEELRADGIGPNAEVKP